MRYVITDLDSKADLWTRQDTKGLLGKIFDSATHGYMLTLSHCGHTGVLGGHTEVLGHHTGVLGE